METLDFYKEKATAYERAFNIAQTKYTLMERISFGYDSMSGMKKIPEGTGIYIYGAGTIGRFFCKMITDSSKHNILGYIERDNSGECEGIKLYSLKESDKLNKDAIIIITPMEYYDGIMSDLKVAGVSNTVMPLFDVL